MTTPTPAPAPMTADKEMAAWLHRTCKAKKVNKTYGCDNFHCVYCRAARHIGIDAEHIDALTARVAGLERDAISALKERERLREALVRIIAEDNLGLLGDRPNVGSIARAALQPQGDAKP